MAYYNGLSGLCRPVHGVRQLCGPLRGVREECRPGGLRLRGLPRKHCPLAHPKNKLRDSPHTEKIKSHGKMSRWSLLVLLVGEGRQAQALEQLKEVTSYLLRTIARQSEVHTSQKLRRGLQLYSVYSRMWGEEAAQKMLANLRRVLISKGRHLLLSAVCFSNFNWNQEKIADDSLQRATRDLETVGDLCQATIKCEVCGKRQVIDQQMSNVDYCLCGGNLGYTDESRVYDSWQPFIEREHHIVWRRKHPVYDHLYAYKVYGIYNDVSLSAFMEVQLNSSYRTEWDDSALQLRVLDTDQDSNSDLVYWLVKFPHFFANRDYVFKRRFAVNSEKNEVVIMSEAVQPDFLPEERGIHRVNEYWSTMVIRAQGDVDKSGIEYTLTYFDNPGTSLPQSITNFIAATGFPNFLKKVHKAALYLQSLHEEGRDVYVSLPAVLRYPKQRKVELPPGELVEPSGPISEELEVSSIVGVDPSTADIKAGFLCESSTFEENTDEITELPALLPTLIVAEDSDNQKKSGNETENIPPVEHVNQHQEESMMHRDSECDMDINESSSFIQGSSVGNIPSVRCESGTSENSFDKSDDPVSDTALIVQIGIKNVSVDLLEAMEVVAPDLEKKSLLLRQIEKLNEKLLKGNEKEGTVMEKLRKLKHKLNSFREEALLKRECSIRKMEELSNRNHYQYMSTDDKTSKQLEMLFQAMRHVLKADRDMRTGKMLMEATQDDLAREMADRKEETPHSNNSELFSTLHHCKNTMDDRPLQTDPKSFDDDTFNINKREEKQKETSKEPWPPEDPPSSSGDGTLAESNQDAMSPDESQSSKDASNGPNGTSNSALNNQPNDGSQWSAGMSASCMSAQWKSIASPHHTDLEGTSEESSRADFGGFLAQIWYVFSLGVLRSEKETCMLGNNSIEQKTLQAGDDTTEKEDTNSSEDFKWYWYPVRALYQVYAWVLSASRVSA